MVLALDNLQRFICHKNQTTSTKFLISPFRPIRNLVPVKIFGQRKIHLKIVEECESVDLHFFYIDFTSTFFSFELEFH